VQLPKKGYGNCPSVNDTIVLLDIITARNGTTIEDRKLFAEAFHVSSHYDTAIFNYFNTDETVQRKY
jgi:phosphoribosylaminoimidazolecarboxamide formyltransferase/IMP cyclohydrolase